MSQPYCEWTGRGRELGDKKPVQGITKNTGNQTKLLRIKQPYLTLVFLESLYKIFIQLTISHRKEMALSKSLFQAL